MEIFLPKMNFLDCFGGHFEGYTLKIFVIFVSGKVAQSVPASLPPSHRAAEPQNRKTEYILITE